MVLTYRQVNCSKISFRDNCYLNLSLVPAKLGADLGRELLPADCGICRPSGEHARGFVLAITKPLGALQTLGALVVLPEGLR